MLASSDRDHVSSTAADHGRIVQEPTMGSEKKTVGSSVLSQSLFNTAYVPSPTWRSYLTSGIIHGAIVLALLLITFPALEREVEEHRVDNVTLIAPRIAEDHPKVVRPHVVELVKNQPRRLPPPPKPVNVKPVTVPPPVIAAAPEVKAPPVTPVQPLPDLKPEPPAPKPQIHTGSFQAAEAAKAPLTPKVTKVGGFGDPNGVLPSADSRPSSLTMARVGSFDLPVGDGHSGGGGRGTSGGVRPTSFGSAGDTSGIPGGTGRGGGTVHTGAFGESAVAAGPNPTVHPRPVEPVFTPVEILYKPKPAYTQEARDLKLEGQVSLDVVFLSNGSIRILRVIHGLGHGLDEAAQQAALQVRFRPATRGGVPVDTNATIHITFELT